MTISVLVLPAHLRPGPWVCRSLTRAGHRVVAGSDRRLVGSRIAGNAVRSRRVESSTLPGGRFVESVARVVREESIDVILPLAESALAMLLLEGSPDVVTRVAGPSPMQYLRLADKWALAALAEEVGIPTLAGTIVTAGHHPGELPPPPVVVKPAHSVSRVGGASLYVRPRLAETAEERDAAVRETIAATGSALVQPYAVGARWHVHAWRSAHGSGGVAARVERSWPSATGMTSASRIDEAGDALIAPLVRLLGGIGFRGVASADFIGDPGAGAALHDVNPRLPFSVAEAIGAGLDTPAIAVEIALGREPAARLRPLGDGHRYHWLSAEMRALGARGGRRSVAGLVRAACDGGAVVDPLARGVVLAGSVDLTGSAIRHLARLGGRGRPLS